MGHPSSPWMVFLRRSKSLAGKHYQLQVWPYTSNNTLQTNNPSPIPIKIITAIRGAPAEDVWFGLHSPTPEVATQDLRSTRSLIKSLGTAVSITGPLNRDHRNPVCIARCSTSTGSGATTVSHDFTLLCFGCSSVKGDRCPFSRVLSRGGCMLPSKAISTPCQDLFGSFEAGGWQSWAKFSDIQDSWCSKEGVGKGSQGPPAWLRGFHWLVSNLPIDWQSTKKFTICWKQSMVKLASPMELGDLPVVVGPCMGFLRWP